jgi:hypothetical protein
MTEETHELPELVTLGEFPEPIEAEMVKLRLESAGIETFLSGENAAILAPGLGPLHLQVKPEDETDARAILSDTGEPGVMSSYTGVDLEPEKPE